jgi:hypothetical protein
MVLTTNQINEWLSGQNGFLGVFSINKLPQQVPSIPNKISFVVNLDSDNLPGTHWIAIIRLNFVCEIFDSFGIVPPSEIQIWCTKHSNNNWICNSKCIQDPTSTLCGVYCCLFITCRPKFNSMLDTTKYLSRLV